MDGWMDYSLFMPSFAFEEYICANVGHLIILNFYFSEYGTFPLLQAQESMRPLKLKFSSVVIIILLLFCWILVHL